MNSLKITATGEQIPFITASISAAIDSWLWDFGAEVADKVALNKLIPLSNLRNQYVLIDFSLGSETWALIVENADSNDTGFSYSIRARSKSVLLAEPYSLPITKTWTMTTASAIVQELCDDAGITLSWQVLDWLITSYVAEKVYPIDIISELVADLGAKLQSLPNGTLAAVYYPAVSPAQLQALAPDYQLANQVPANLK